MTNLQKSEVDSQVDLTLLLILRLLLFLFGISIQASLGTRRDARTVEPERGANSAVMAASCSASGTRARSVQRFGVGELSRVREARRARLRELWVPRLRDAAMTRIARPTRRRFGFLPQALTP